MADDKSDLQEPEAVGTAEETDTTTTEEVSLDDFDDGESWGIEEKAEEASDDEAATESDESDAAEPEDDVASEDADTEEESEEAEEKPVQDDAAERKRYNDEMAKARIEAKRAREEADRVRTLAEESKIEQYLKDAEDDELEYKQRELDIREYRQRQQQIGLNESRLEADLTRAVASIPLFRDGTPAVQKRLLKAIDLFEANNIVKDKKGRPVEVKGDIYQYLQEEADSITELLGDGARTATNAKTKQQTRTMTPPVKAPKKAKVDPDIEGFDDAVARGW